MNLSRGAFLPIVLAAGACAQQVPLRVLPLQAQTAHVQGIDTDGVHLWVTSVERASKKGFLQEFTVADGKLIRTIQVQDGDRYHPGGFAADAQSLWIPVAEYKAKSSAVIQRRNKLTWTLEFQFPVPDHIGCLAVTPEFLIGGNWDSRDFYVWDHQGKLIRKIPNSSGNSYQDMKFRDGRLLASGLLPGGRSAVDWLDWPALSLVSRTEFDKTDRGLPMSREGMTLFQDRLWFLPEDSQSRLFVLPSH